MANIVYHMPRQGQANIIIPQCTNISVTLRSTTGMFSRVTAGQLQ